MGLFDFMGKTLLGIILIILTIFSFFGFLFFIIQQKLTLAYTILGIGLLLLLVSRYFIKQAEKIVKN